MDTIHQLSHATPLPEFDIFGVPGTQTTVMRDLVTEHRPISSVESSSVIQFEIPTSTDEYVRFDETELYIKAKFDIKQETDKDGKNIAKNWYSVSPINYLLHSMIKQIDVFIGDKLVSASP